ncbi:MAG: hypothetical protein KC776_31780 [Myxococcales bacterium]|nr:hypothetical protein [Myxococcales bacterium]
MRAAAFVFVTASFVLLAVACGPQGGNGGSGTGGAAGFGAGGSGGGSGSSGGGTGGVAGSGGGSTGTALSPTTFVFQRRIDDSRDHLLAMDYATGQERVISTLVQPNSDGWNIDGVAVSPDRTRIVIASGYGPTQEDVATGMVANRVWSMNTDGGDMLRLTPVFQGGIDTQKVDVRNPAFTPDGQNVFYEYGEYNGGSWFVAPWWVAANGSAVPSLFQTSLGCSINGNVAFNPATGDLLMEHTVCIPGTKGGYYLYPAAGGAPVQLVDEAGANLERPVFSHDGSAFLFTARSASDGIQSAYLYFMAQQQIAPVIDGASGVDIVNGAIAPDDAHIVYCVQQGSSTDLHVLDLTVDPPADKVLTNDGASCDPVF